jgi:hypothetical protein
VSGRLVTSEVEAQGDLLGGQFTKATVRWANQDSYEGRMLNGELHERGIYRTAEGDVVEAQFDRGTPKKAWRITTSSGVDDNASSTFFL